MNISEADMIKETDTVAEMNDKLRKLSVEYGKAGPMPVEEYIQLRDKVKSVLDESAYVIRERLLDKHKNLYTNIETLARNTDEIFSFSIMIKKRG